MDAEEHLHGALADPYRIEGPIGRGGMATVDARGPSAHR